MTHTPKYQKRHYEDVARLLRDVRRSAGRDFDCDAHVCESTVHIIAGQFSLMFKADNPNFNCERFRAAYMKD